MERYAGDPKFPLWLIADSEPENWRRFLLTPLDPRHPARHNIWTSVLDYMQDTLYRRQRLRIDTRRLFIQNAVTDPSDKPERNMSTWSSALQGKVGALRTELLTYSPKVILTFGSFAFEFTRRACNEQQLYAYSHWSTLELGKEFKKRVISYSVSGMKILPLLHVTIARGKFLESNKHFVDEGEHPNYFEYVGVKLGELFMDNLSSEAIWVK